jgi:hypothetical protein
MLYESARTGLCEPMRIHLDDPSRSPALRDYFLRLGAEGTINADATVDVAVHEGDDLDLETSLESWALTNQVNATVVSEEAATQPVLALAQPAPAPDAWTPPVRLGDLLVSKGFISNEQLAHALVESREKGELVGRVLLRNRWIYEDELARTLAEQWSLPYLNLASIGADLSAMRLLPAEVGLQAAAVPVRFMNGGVQVAFADPSDQSALDAVREYLPTMTPAVAELTDITMLWRKVTRAAS